jgi:hypothetical protein
MARWALWMLIVTTGMAAITAFGVFFVWRTLLATQDMARDTRTIGEAQVRAYLSFEIDRPIIEEQDGGAFAKIGLQGRLVNSGQTPALHPSIEAFIALAPSGYRHKIVGDEFHKAGMSAIAIPANGSINQSVSNRLPFERDKVASGELFLFFMIAIEYTDVFGARCEPEVMSGWLMDVMAKSPKVVWSEVTPADKTENA